MKKQERARRALCTAMIADIIGSRSVPPSDREELQRELKTTLKHWNHQYRSSILARFTITTGDEFQGLLKSPSVLVEIMRSLERSIPQVQFRIGVGFGELFTDLSPTAVGMDGPVWHNAREAVNTAKTRDQLGGVFVGFADQTLPLNSIARFLYHHFYSMTPQQRQIAEMLRHGSTVKTISEKMKLPSTNVSRQKKAIAWNMLEEGEAALKNTLNLFDTADAWTE